ncbi:cysteine hydrolase [Aestuariirhabdus sp. Z084]|uniref:cysteine hydrolase family protein n=1 Tax=Aestuariirhabdus haliotis TaxID=2918751 RepID=UPI00201B4391|nr:isochorismatase family cysteine hydrolase [Aestuariirhabdus haliotis]MCL6416978.1 cysteine hydrolase [Aestuariirhabdus haliotis]MCL6421015.1 cysteine hydrolase [Aestuariirhabdus haliotis]
MSHYTAPELSSSALITIDTQNDFTLPGAPALIEGTAQVVPNMQRLLEFYRHKALPIIHVVRIYRKDGSNVDLCRKESVEQGLKLLLPGSHGVELVDEIKPDGSPALDAELLLSGAFQSLGNDEFAMYKPRWGAFFETDLDAFLKQRGVNTLVFCGCNFPNCPRTSLYQASERDFRLLLIQDAISQLYPRGEQELANIAVRLQTTDQFLQV